MSRKYRYQDASENVRINRARQRYGYIGEYHTRHLMREAAERAQKRRSDFEASDPDGFAATKLKRNKPATTCATGGATAIGSLAFEEGAAAPVSAIGVSAIALTGTLLAIGVGAAAVTNNTLLKDDESLDTDERASLSVGRKMSYVGGVGGAVATMGAISASGAVAGLSGAGVISGITAIGASIGGGVVAGSIVVAALPVVAATGVGYCAYKVYRSFRKGKSVDKGLSIC